MHKTTPVEPLARYLYRLQLALAPLPYDEAEEILFHIESDLNERVDALVDEGVGSERCAVEQSIIERLMRPERLAQRYISSFEHKSAREFRAEGVATNVLAGTALFAAFYDHSAAAVTLATCAMALSIFRIWIHVTPVQAAARIARWLPFWKVLSALTGLAAATFLVRDIWSFDLSVHIANHRASALFAVNNLPLRDLAHALVVLLAFLTQCSGSAAATLNRDIRDQRRLRTRTATWRSRRMRNPMLPERDDDIDGYWQLHDEVAQYWKRHDEAGPGIQE